MTVLDDSLVKHNLFLRMSILTSESIMTLCDAISKSRLLNQYPLDALSFGSA
jgi:hypothetical protein